MGAGGHTSATVRPVVWTSSMAMMRSPFCTWPLRSALPPSMRPFTKCTPSLVSPSPMPRPPCISSPFWGIVESDGDRRVRATRAITFPPMFAPRSLLVYIEDEVRVGSRAVGSSVVPWTRSTAAVPCSPRIISTTSATFLPLTSLLSTCHAVGHFELIISTSCFLGSHLMNNVADHHLPAFERGTPFRKSSNQDLARGMH